MKNEYPLWMRLCMTVGPFWSFIIGAAIVTTGLLYVQHVALNIHF